MAMSSERLAFGSGGKNVKRAEGAGRETIAGRSDTIASTAVVRADTADHEIRNTRHSARARREPRDWAFTWTLIFTAAVFLRPQDLIPPLAVLHLPEVAAIGGLASLFSSRVRRGQPVTRVTPDLVGVLLLGAVMLLTAPFSVWMGGALHLFEDMYSKVIMVYVLALNVTSSPRRVERFTWVLVLSVSYIALLSVVNYVRGVDVIMHGARVRGAVGGVMRNPNDLALNMVSFLPLAAFVVMRPGSIGRRAVAAGCVLLMVATIVATDSRGGFLGFAAMMLVLGAFAVRRRPGFVIAGVLAALCMLPIVPQHYWERLASITNEKLDQTGSEQARRELMKESFNAFLENPLTGVGAGQFVNWAPDHREQAAHEAHDVFLQVAADLGIVGLAVFVFLIGRAFMVVYQTRRLITRARRPRRTGGTSPVRADTSPTPFDEQALELLDAHSAAMAAALTGWLVCALFASVAYNWTFYYLLVLAVTPCEMLRDRLPARTRARQVRVGGTVASEAARA
jgi:putative inorganic carbon (HCO3(-)) transporter